LEGLTGEKLHGFCPWGFMPQVSSFYGIVITMYFGDHAPPPFHARYGEEGAKIEIAGGEVLAGSLSASASPRAKMGRAASRRVGDELAARCSEPAARTD